MKLLLDTNVVIDFYSRRQPFFEDMQKVWIAAYFSDAELWVNTRSFTDAECILRKAVGIEDLRAMMSASLEMFNLCASLPSEMEDALSSGWPDLEDCLIALSAKRIGADFILTRDSAGFERSQVKAVSPASFLKILEDEAGITYAELPLDGE